VLVFYGQSLGVVFGQLLNGGWEYDYKETILFFIAKEIASARLETFNLERILLM
jgi:hypothetical protein